MKKSTLFFVLIFTTICFAQNQSDGVVQSSITSPIAQQTGEIFRFDQGLVTQLDDGSDFGFTNSRWFSLGSLNTGSQTVYGLRFQLPNRAITFGYQSLADNNPRIQWIGSSGSNLEFRSSNSFTSTISNLVATMNSNGQTFFGDLFSSSTTRVGINYTGVTSSTRTGLTLQNTSSFSSGVATGISLTNNEDGYIKTGVNITAVNGSNYANQGVNINLSGGVVMSGVSSRLNSINSGSSTVAVRGSIIGEPTSFGAGIYGYAPAKNPNWYAGYFNGTVVVNGSFSSSDKKLKQDIKSERNSLEKLTLLDAVTYTFKPNENLSLPENLQHGFVAQDIEKVFPELVSTVKKPILDKENNPVDIYEYKVVNYIGLISILTSSINELNDKVTMLEGEIEDTKSGNVSNIVDKEAFTMEQNKPNPFSNKTVINYTVPRNVKANITVFDMTGKFIKDYNLVSQSGQISINANDIGKGMFIYSLTVGNEEIITKRMIVK